jgi:hypothetical protein
MIVPPNDGGSVPKAATLFQITVAS